MRETVRREILPDVWMTSTRTDSYRTGFFSVLLVTELKRDTAAKNALLPRVLRRGTAEYPDVRAVSEALDELYGGEISPVAVTWGELQGVGFVSRFTDEALLPGKPKITEKMIRLVGGMLLDPMTRGGMLLSKDLDDMKMNIHKIQCVLPAGLDRTNLQDLDIMTTEQRGSLLTLTVRGQKEEIQARMQSYHPVFFEMIPLSLEEIFISETEVVGYDIKKLIF